ncbi:MAG TPA: AAA family ATPase [Gaiellaceae bacterium]|nr:AAA family ATPase [Gaiellaceae bacterium]
MRICGACGQENPENARFCLACGSPLETVEPREERRVISVLFVDLVGFTARAERLDPEDVRAILTPYHDCVRREIESFGGVVEKFIGDAVMAVFGAPTAFGDDAERAVQAAFAVRESVKEMNERDPNLELGIRIAVNTGEAIVTLDARPALGESMVAGDVVNTASRLQSAAPLDGIVAGRETYAATRHAIVFEAGPAVEAKGKKEPVEVWVALRPAETDGEPIVAEALIGRERELEMLQGVWERVASERTPQLLTLFGPAGVGKTRLARAFAERAEELGGRMVRGRSLPYRESSAYWAFATQVKQFCHIFDSDPVEVGLEKLRATTSEILAPGEAPVVAEHLAIILGFDDTGAVADRETLFLSVRRFIEATAREQPTMLVFEDVHWADPGLLDLIELLAARLHDLPLLILTLARPELLDTRPGWGGGLLTYTALRLGPLAESDAVELALRRQPALADEAQRERVARLVEMAGGNALFIEQLAATLSESPDSGSETSLPTTVRGILAGRLDALPAAERTLLLDAAVAGKVFWRGGLEGMTQNGGEMSELLGALERRDLIRREAVSAIEGDEQYAFTHVLIRDVAYELLPRARRQQRHEELARFLERATAEVGEAAASTARHWRDAGDRSRAIDYFVTAAEHAERGWAKEQALALYREALKLVPEDDESRRKALRRRVALADQAVYHLEDARLLRRTEAERD